MTSALEVELTAGAAGELAGLRQDAPLLIAIARKLHEDDDLRYEHCAIALDAMARRMTERVRVLERLEERGLLDDTQTLAIADLADDHEPGTDHAPETTPTPNRTGRRT